MKLYILLMNKTIAFSEQLEKYQSTSIALFSICFGTFSKESLTSSESTYFTSNHVIAIQFQQFLSECTKSLKSS